MAVPDSVVDVVEQLRLRQRSAWLRGERPLVETLLPDQGVLADDLDLRLDLIYAEYCLREEIGETVSFAEYAARFPQYVDRLKPVFELHKAMMRAPAATSDSTGAKAGDTSKSGPFGDECAASTSLHKRNLEADPKSVGGEQHLELRAGRIKVCCPGCRTGMTIAVDTLMTELTCGSCGTRFSLIQQNEGENLAPSLAKMGRFDLVGRLGVGAFGSVWKAHDLDLDRTVAVKIPRCGEMTGEEQEKFLREARAAAQLRHPNIVSVHEVGRSDGSVYIVSDFVPGVTLRDWLRDQLPTAREATQLCATIAEALHYAHSQGITHRDLKPANIMIDAGGQPHIMDFGLARRDMGEVTVTLDGHVLGTPAYMSPEQAAGKSHAADRRSDVYSLGVILFESLTGELPFRGNVRMLMHQVINDEPPSPRKFSSSVPKDLEVITLKCLEKDPARRFNTAQAFAEELRRFLSGTPIESRAISTAERAWRWCQRHPSVSSLTASIVTITLVALVVVTWQWLALRRAVHQRTISDVEKLIQAVPEEVPRILDDLEPRRAEVVPHLRPLLEDKNLNAKQRRRILLALLADDPSHTQRLAEEMLSADSQEFVVLRDELLANGNTIADRMWNLFDDQEQPAAPRFRAGMFLAADQQTDPSRWAAHADFMSDRLVKLLLDNPAEFNVLVDGLQPMREQLTGPLATAFRDGNRPDRELDMVAHILKVYGAEQPELLIGLLLDSRPAQFPVLFSVLANDRLREQTKALLRIQLTISAATRSGEELDRRAKQIANTAIALVQLGVTDHLGPLLAEKLDPTARSYFIARFRETRSKPDALAGLVDQGVDDQIRRAAYLTLGAFPRGELQSVAAFSKENVLATYENDPDPGVHSAARWVLTQWELRDEVDQIDQRLRQRRGNVDLTARRWFVNGQGHTMLIHGPGEFFMGSPADEQGRMSNPGENLHRRRINRTFAIAACETTIGQFSRSNPTNANANRADYPVASVSWSEAARYCNWLSDREGIPRDQWCYEEVANGNNLMRPAENCLSLAGYRLPTEAEWEYACRAGSTTARFFGHSPELLPEYAWCPRNSADGDLRPVALKMPNDDGLFDLYGNAIEWCHDHADEYLTEIGTELDVGGPPNAADGYEAPDARVMRGSAVGDVRPARSALRDVAPDNGIEAVGFRIAKTIKLDDN